MVRLKPINPGGHHAYQTRLITLLKQYYPLHDRLCAIEGEYIRQAVVGEEGAREKLALISKDMNKMIKKYFALD